MDIRPLEFRGQPALQASLDDGSTVVVALHGAHVLSWITADGIERLYLSPDAVFDGEAAIRGGIPVCCPQFNQRGALPKHGFMRNVPWRLVDSDNHDTLTLRLEDSAATLALWPHAFEATLAVSPLPRGLRTALTLRNTGTAPFSFTAALHTYLRVDDIADVRLEGLQGAARWDAVRDVRQTEETPALAFSAEFDSVYAAPAHPLRLTDVAPRGTLQIAQSPSCTETVVWNPGAALSAKLADMPDDGYRHMLCVEAAHIDAAVLLAAGAEWQGWQQLNVL
ncbi:MAG: D-hexose-6-phosphate mutarotase [Variovorax sp.]|nr:MAG: D-hexose-6-phosphate mutarotase [Variovorax sp.]